MKKRILSPLLIWHWGSNPLKLTKASSWYPPLSNSTTSQEGRLRGEGVNVTPSLPMVLVESKVIFHVKSYFSDLLNRGPLADKTTQKARLWMSDHFPTRFTGILVSYKSFQNPKWWIVTWHANSSEPASFEKQRQTLVSKCPSSD